MKKVISWIVILGITGVLIFFIFRPKKEEKEFLVLTESQYILYDEDEKLVVTYFTNDLKFKLVNSSTGGFLSNDDESIKFIIEDISLKEIHSEVYKNKKYFGYEIHISLPNLNDSYYLEKAYLKLVTNSNTYNLFIGEVFVKYANDLSNFKSLGLEGIKRETGKLYQILVNLENTDNIEDIYIGDYLCDYFIYDDKLLVIEVPLEIKYLFFKTYVQINLSDNTIYLPYFKYIIEYELLKSGYFQKYLII